MMATFAIFSVLLLSFYSSLSAPARRKLSIGRDDPISVYCGPMVGIGLSGTQKPAGALTSAIYPTYDSLHISRSLVCR